MDKTKIIEQFNGGMTYDQIAKDHQVTRNVVAGIVDRARRNGLVFRFGKREPKPKPVRRGVPSLPNV